MNPLLSRLRILGRIALFFVILAAIGGRILGMVGPAGNKGVSEAIPGPNGPIYTQFDLLEDFRMKMPWDDWSVFAEYVSGLQPVTEAYFAKDITWASTMESSGAVTSPDIGTAGTVDGADFASGKYGNGARFNADTESIDVAVTNGTDYNKSIGTVEFWFQPTWNHTDGVQHTLWTLHNSATNRLIFRHDSSNNIDFIYEQGGTAITYTISSANYSWSANDWVHIRATWDDSATNAEQQHVYINGVEPTHTDGSSSINGASMTSPTELLIGDGNTTAFEAAGIIDEFRLYNSVLGPDPIAKNGNTADPDEYLFDTADDYTLSFAAVDANKRGEYFYMGYTATFPGIQTSLATLGSGTNPAMTWQYWNGTAWADLTITEADTGAKNFTASGGFYWTVPGDWAAYSVNGGADLYYIRGKLASGSFSTSPIEDTIQIGTAIATDEDSFFFMMD